MLNLKSYTAYCIWMAGLLLLVWCISKESNNTLDVPYTTFFFFIKRGPRPNYIILSLEGLKIQLSTRLNLSSKWGYDKWPNPFYHRDLSPIEYMSNEVICIALRVIKSHLVSPFPNQQVVQNNIFQFKLYYPAEIDSLSWRQSNLLDPRHKSGSSASDPAASST